MTSESMSNFSREKKNNCFFFSEKPEKKTVLSENELVSRAQTFPGKKNTIPLHEVHMKKSRNSLNNFSK